MKITIDCRMWGKKYGGIGRYIQEIVLNLIQTKSWIFVLIISDNSIKQEIESFVKDSIVEIKYYICRAKMFSLAEQIELPRIIPSCDIFWSPYMNVPFLLCRAKKRVVTLHDVFHLANPQYYSFLKRLFISPFYYFSTRNSNLILTVSNFSKREVSRCCGSKIAQKTVVVYNGCDIDTNLVRDNHVSFSYILFVGSIKPHKNLRNALLGYQKMNNKNIKFVIVGKKEGFLTGDEEVFAIVDRLNGEGERVIFTGNISDEELYGWYKGAIALVQPSFYEGFGLPIIEAMNFGLPIACSDIPVFREIGKNLVSYFNPYSPESIASCLETVVTMPKKVYPNWISWKDTAMKIADKLEMLKQNR